MTTLDLVNQRRQLTETLLLVKDLEGAEIRREQLQVALSATTAALAARASAGDVIARAALEQETETP